MNSWDLFDTLVASRPMAPAGDHIGELYPIVENVSRVKEGDIIVSDYYNPQIAEKVLREVTGLRNKIIVTPCGKYNGDIWPTLHNIEIHRGDNRVADFEQPTKHGINSELIRLADWTNSEAKLKDANMEGLALACRETRLTTWRTKFRELQILQIEANFPLLVLASLALHTYAIDNKIDRLLMSARDACLWVGIQEDIRNRLNGDYEVEYTPSSRVCRNVPTDKYLLEINKRLEKKCLFVDIGSTGKSLARLATKTKSPEIGIFLITQYNWTNADGYGDIELKNIYTLLSESDNVLESVNTATHGMYIDWDRQLSTSFDWEREEILVMHTAFNAARKVLHNYPLPTYNKDAIKDLFTLTRDLVAGNLDFLRAAIHWDEIERVKRESQSH